MAKSRVFNGHVIGVERNLIGRFTRVEIGTILGCFESRDSMLAIRIYLSALTLTFLVVALMTRGIGVLEATVVVCALLYTILDVREELKALRSLEARVLSLSR
jgi:hypothetical protein